MGPSDLAALRLHQDASRFREAVNATAAATGFGTRVIEKDYFCTVLLQYLAPIDGALVFKGGTCLAKVHAGFHRLSEDLDFVIPTPVSASRAERSRRARSLRALLAGIDSQVPGVRLSRQLEGANNSTQYIAVLRYRSLLGDVEDTIKFEVGLREPLLTPAVRGEAQTLLIDPVSGLGLVPALALPCLSRKEAMAEKLRAALCRRDVAIRDFFDVDHAVHGLGIRLDDPQSIGLVRQKLDVPGNDPADVSPARLDALRAQVEAELRPVLSAMAFAAFDLDRAIATIRGIAQRVA